ncbi:MAG TPA: O-antigen ligase family protein, partial [Burkholderiales bacterium]|nr:O-antigen ligase family protein [Burkholderiales bacterium]
EWGGAMDLLRYASIAWLVKRGRYSAQELRWALGALAVSALIGLAVGYFRMWTGIGKSGRLQLYSVGHVNHTAIYLAMVLGLWAAWVFAAYRSWTPRMRVAGTAFLAILLASLAVTSSRGAVGAGILALFLLAFSIFRRWSAPLKITVISTVVLIGSAVLVDSDLVRKQERREAEGNPLSHRDSIWRMGIAAWKEQPWFGVGMDNYGQITHERMQAWRARDGKSYDPKGLMPFVHAHSLYVNTLAERGIVGFAALAAVLFAWGAALVRYRPAPSAPDGDWILWGASASGLIVTLGAGLFNTSLHHEHGILAALLLGLWLGRPERHLQG